MFTTNRSPIVRCLTKSIQFLVAASLLLASAPAPAAGAGVLAVEPVATNEEPPEPPSFVSGVGRAARGIELYAVCNPPVVTPGGEAACTISVYNGAGSDLAGLALSARLPSFVAVAGEGGGSWEAPLASLAAGETAQAALPLAVGDWVTGPRAFDVELADEKGSVLAATTAVLGVRTEEAQQIDERGGAFASGDGRVSVAFPAEALTGTVGVAADVLWQRPAHEEGRFRGGSLLRFELNARDAATDAPVHAFAAPVTLEVDVRGLVDADALPAGWHLYLATVVDEATGEAEMVEAAYDAERGVVVAQVDHFSTWDLGTVGEGWKPLLTPPVPDLFSGAATYGFPVELPPGRNGMGPSVTLSYNSRRVDGLIDGGDEEVEAGPIALGWSLGASDVEVTRRSKFGHYGQLRLYDSFTLVLNGTSHDLLPDAPGQLCGRYHVQGAPGVYAERRNNSGGSCTDETATNETSDYWIVRTANGTTYWLGFDASSEVTLGQDHTMFVCDGFCAPDGGRYGAVRSRVDRIEDTMGNAVVFGYREKDIDTGYVASTTERSLVLEILYNNYGSAWASKVTFIAVSNDEEDEGFMRIKRIDVEHLGETVRQVALTTSLATWVACGQSHSERALTEIQVKSGDGTETFEPVLIDHVGLQNFVGETDGVGCFTYRRVWRIDNGYGGQVEFKYEHDGRTDGELISGIGEDPPQLPNYGYSYRVVETLTSDGRSGETARATYAYGTRCYDQYGGNTEGGALCRGAHAPEVGPLVGHDWVETTAYAYDGTTVETKGKHTYYITDTGTNPPHWKRGKEYETEVYDGASALLQESETTWAGDSTFSYVSQAVARDYSGGVETSGKTTYVYAETEQGGAQYGNVTHVREYESEGAGAPYRTTVTEYVVNTDPGVWIVGAPHRVRVYDGNTDGTVVSEALTYYDRDEYGKVRAWGSAPTEGLVVRQEQVDPSTAETVGAESWYDDRGNVAQVVGARGYTSTTTYDGTYDLYPVEACNVLEQCARTEYYGVNATGAPAGGGLPGQAYRAWDANGEATAVEYRYDALGRLIKVIRPGDSALLPSVEYRYELATEEVFHEDFETGCTQGVIPARWRAWNLDDETCQAGSAYEGTWGVRVAGPGAGGNGALYNGKNDKVPLEPSALYRVRVALRGTGSVQVSLDTGEGWKYPFTTWAPASWQVKEGTFSTSSAGGEGGTGELHVWALMPSHTVDVDVDEVLVERVVGLRITTVTPDAGAPGGTAEAHAYLDGWGRQVQGRAEAGSGQWVVSSSEYDALGRAVKGYAPRFEAGEAYTPPGGLYTATTYDAWGRAVQVENPDGTYVETAYAGRRVTAVDANRHQRVSESDAWGRLAQVEEYEGTVESGPTLYATTEYDYDVLGNLTVVTDTLGNVTTMGYDGLGRKTEMDDPDMGHWEYGYDPGGNLITQTDALGQVLVFEYDELNRLVSKSADGHVVAEYGYDCGGDCAAGNYGVGRRTAMTDTTGVTTWTYDVRGRVVKESRKIGGETFDTSFTYDTLDRPKTTTYPDGEVVTQTYDERGLPETLGSSLGETFVTGVSYNEMGQITSLSLENGLTTGYAYDPLNFRLERLNTGGLLDLSYEYDAGGNVTAIHDGAQGEEQRFAYDALDRLVEAGAVGETVIGEVGQIDDALTDAAYTVVLDRTYVDPVVFAQPLSRDGGDTAVVRITDVQGDRFTLYVHDAPNMSSAHTTESVSYVVLEAGSWVLANGSLLQVGKVDTAATVGRQVSNVWASVTFDSGYGYAGTPVVVSQVQSENDAHWVKTRQTNVTGSGFDVALEEDEAQTTAHGTETIGWLALKVGRGEWSGHAYEAAQTANAVTQDWYQVTFGQAFAAAPRFVGGVATYEGSDPVYLRYDDATLAATGVQVMLEEDTTYDTETTHYNPEVVHYLALEGDGALMGRPHAPVGEEAMGEVGQITDALTDAPYLVELDRTYDDPVVFAQPLSRDGGDTAVVRITDVQGDRFTLYVHDAPNMSSAHTTESVSYVVLEAGSWVLPGGVRLEVGKVDTAATVGRLAVDTWEWVSFGSRMGGAPAVVSQVQTDNDAHWVKTRQTGVTAEGVYVALEEDEAQTEPHGTETIGWLAMETGVGTWSGHAYEAEVTAEEVTQDWTQVTFTQAFAAAPRFVGGLATYNGGNPAYLRYDHATLGATGVQVMVEEDTTYDAETTHYSAEGVAYLALEGDGVLNAAPYTAWAAEVYDRSYAYDEIGNVTFKEGVGAYTYEGNAQPHAVTHLDGEQRYWYDANGNMVSRTEKGVTYTQAFNAESKLVQVSWGTNETTFAYDGDGVRVMRVFTDSQSVVTTTYYVGGLYELEVDGNSRTVTKYYHAGGQRVAMRVDDGISETLTYLHGDHLGSTSLATSAAGAQVSRVLYYPYGETRYENGTLPTDFGFTGQRKDSYIDMIQMGARWYDPYLSRWISPDTIIPDPANPQSLNRFSYVRGNPLKYVDPTGHYEVDLCDYAPSGCGYYHIVPESTPQWVLDQSYPYESDHPKPSPHLPWFIRERYADLQWREQILLALEGAGPRGRHAAQYIRDNNVRFGFTRQKSTGARWNLLGNISFNTEHFSTSIGPWHEKWPKLVDAAGHEALHLEQGILLALSVEGEAEATLLSVEIRDALGDPINDVRTAEIVRIASGGNLTDADLEAIRAEMLKFPGYRADLLALRPETYVDVFLRICLSRPYHPGWGLDGFATGPLP